MRLSQHVTMIALILVMAAPVLAGGLGEPAPALQIAEWVKGDPLVLADGKDQNVYVIVFWASSSVPSRVSLVHLTEMQKEYEDKNVVFIAISGEKPEVVKAFMEENGSKLEYRVAVDQDGACTAAYMRGFRVGGVPHAFVIDKSGNVVWHGHPRGRGLGKTIDAVVAGTYDIEAGRRLEQAYAMAALYVQRVRSPKWAKRVGPLGAKILENARDDIILLNDLAWVIATEPGLIKRDFDLALSAVKFAYEVSEGKDADILDTYARVLFESGNKTEAVKHQQRAVELASDDVQRQKLEKVLDKYVKAADDD